MQNLVLIRHSEAELTYSEKSDFDRHLTSKGRLLAVEQAKKLENMQIIPQFIVSSSALRARQTSELFAEVFGKMKIELIPWLYDDYTTNDFLTLIGQFDDNLKNVIIIGHNPSISVMASRLSGRQIGFKPCDGVVLGLIKPWANAEVGLFELRHWLKV